MNVGTFAKEIKFSILVLVEMKNGMLIRRFIFFLSNSNTDSFIGSIFCLFF